MDINYKKIADMNWLVDGKPLQWKIMVMTQAGVFFLGQKDLVKNPDEAKWFDKFEDAADESKNIVGLNLSGVTQVRIISSAFA